MKPKINGTEFGSITIEKEIRDYDVVIRMDGEVEKRKKKLSKAVYGSSHVVSLDEAKHVYENGAESIIVGAGQSSMLRLSDEAKDYFDRKKCKVKIYSTPEAIEAWNKEEGKKTIGLFHVTC